MDRRHSRWHKQAAGVVLEIRLLEPELLLGMGQLLSECANPLGGRIVRGRHLQSASDGWETRAETAVTHTAQRFELALGCHQLCSELFVFFLARLR